MTEAHREHVLALVEGATSGPTLVITGGVVDGRVNTLPLAV